MSTQSTSTNAVTMSLVDFSGLASSVATVWVAGRINGSRTIAALQPDGSFGGTALTSVPFYALSSIPSVTLSVATNDNDRLIFVVSKSQPADLSVRDGNLSLQFSQYPYAHFIANEATSHGPIDSGPPTPPAVDGQYFGISDLQRHARVEERQLQHRHERPLGYILGRHAGRFFHGGERPERPSQRGYTKHLLG